VYQTVALVAARLRSGAAAPETAHASAD